MKKIIIMTGFLLVWLNAVYLPAITPERLQAIKNICPADKQGSFFIPDFIISYI